ncbi:hypothetical protein Dimus_008060, partial [Dionaea muscipula]
GFAARRATASLLAGRQRELYCSLADNGSSTACSSSRCSLLGPREMPATRCSPKEDPAARHLYWPRRSSCYPSPLAAGLPRCSLGLTIHEVFHCSPRPLLVRR